MHVIKRDASSKKGKLLCCKRIFDQIKANLAEIQPKNHQNVQKKHFLEKAPGVNGLKAWKQKMFQFFYFLQFDNGFRIPFREHLMPSPVRKVADFNSFPVNSHQLRDVRTVKVFPPAES